MTAYLPNDFDALCIQVRSLRNDLIDRVWHIAKHSGCENLTRIAFACDLRPLTSRTCREPFGKHLVLVTARETNQAQATQLVERIADGLKERPRDGSPVARAAFRLELEEVEILNVMIRLWEQAGKALAGDDPYVLRFCRYMIVALLDKTNTDSNRHWPAKYSFALDCDL